MKMRSIAAATLLAAAAGGAYGDTVNVLDPNQGWIGFGVDITSTQAPAGQNGSLEFTATSSSPSTLLKLNPGGNVFGVLGDLTAVEFDWYKNSSSTVPPGETIGFTLWLASEPDLDVATTTFLTWQFGGGDAPTDQWVTQQLSATDFQADGPQPGSDWLIFGFQFFVGLNGTGDFFGHADNLRLEFGGGDAVFDYNFEPQVIPLPPAAWAGLLGLAMIPIARRIRNRNR